MEAQEKWDKLDEANRQRLLEKFRNCNTDYDWWEGVYEQFKEKCEGLGIAVYDIYFSGFWSQGDGACFEGGVSDWEKFLKACNLEAAYLAGRAIEASDPSIDCGLSLRWSHHGHYYHSGCVTFDDDLYIDNPFDEEADGLRHTAWQATYGSEGPFVSHLDTMTDYLRGLMDELYRDLEREYEHLSSDGEVTTHILDHQEDEIDYLLETIEESA